MYDAPATPLRITDSRYPSWGSADLSWALWRETFDGGVFYRQRHLQQFSGREDAEDFSLRASITPIPNFVKAALLEVRNAIFQRLRDVLRTGGSESYQQAVAGLGGGIDGRGATMNSFLGTKVLTELLLMGKAGVFVDNPVLPGPRLSDARGVHPYCYAYQAEDILNFATAGPENASEFKAILLRDTTLDFDGIQGLPSRTVQRYRSMWLNDEGTVSLQMYDCDSNPIDLYGNKLACEEPTALALTRIPFVLLDIGDSLIKDVCHHQIALLNLGSSDVNYALRSNFPIYTQQSDGRGVGSHLKSGVNEDGTATSGGQGAADESINVGVTQGIKYGVKAERPGFINPSSEPLRASMELQSSLKDDIRSLVNLAVQNLAARGSAESKSMDNQGLEAGLSFIGLVLESAERKLAGYWSAYEEKSESRREIPVIKYPDRYSLKTDTDRIEEANKLSSLMTCVPGQTVKRELAKMVVQSLLGGKVSVDTIREINREVDESPYTTSNPDTIVAAVINGLVGNKTASMALGFDADEHVQAAADHAERVARIAAAQGVNAGARGVPDLSVDANAGTRERQLANDVTNKSTTEPPVRGPDASLVKK